MATETGGKLTSRKQGGAEAACPGATLALNHHVALPGPVDEIHHFLELLATANGVF